MMEPAKRHGEFVTDFVPQRPLLREAKMVSIRRAATPGQTGLGAYELHMVVPRPKRFAQGAARESPKLRRRLMHFGALRRA
jgi:hypothetical protein